MKDNNDMRTLLGKMRYPNAEIKSNINVSEATNKKQMSMRDMLGLVRNRNILKENNELGNKQASPLDQENEENKMRGYFKDNQIDIQFQPLEIYDNAVFWGGIIDGELGWVFKVTENDATSGFVPKFMGDYDKNDPENDMVIKKLETYYDDFYKYWRDNMIQK